MSCTAQLWLLLSVFACLAAVALAGEDAFEVYCQNARSRIVSTGIFTTKDGTTGLRVCCGTRKADRKTAWYDDITLDRSGSLTPRSCDPAQRNSDSCCFDITPDGVEALPYPLHGLVDADELPPQPAYVKDEGSRGSWLFWSSESMPYSLRVWSDNIQACHEGGGMLLDLPMLSAGYNAVPGVDPSGWSGGTTTVAHLLNALPAYVDDQTPLHAGLRTGFPSDACQQIDITDVIRDHYNLNLPSSYPKFPNQRPYWEASAIYADSGNGPGSDPSGCQAGADGCCLMFYTDANGQLQSTYQSCGGVNRRPSMCFKQRGFGRVSLDPQFVASYDSWEGMNNTCAAFQAPRSRLLVADSFYKRQYGLSALLWNDPVLLDSPLMLLGPNLVQIQGAIGLTQAFTPGLKVNEGWSWSDGQPLPADTPDFYINSNYFSEPNDYRASRLNANNTALGTVNKVEDGAENYATLGVAGGSVQGFDDCPKKPDMSSIVAGFPASSYLTSGDAVAAMFKALTNAEHGSYLDVDLTSGGRKGLCEIQATGSAYDTFEMANCVAYQDSAISGIAFSPGSGTPVFEARCSVTSGETAKLNSWRDSLLKRASITTDQVAACPGGILKFSVTMDSATGLKSIKPLCPDFNGINAGTTTPVPSSKDDSNAGLVAAAVAVPLVAVCCSLLAAALFCLRRRRKQGLAAAGKGSSNIEDGMPSLPIPPKPLARPPLHDSSLTMSTAGIYGARTEPLRFEDSANANRLDAKSAPGDNVICIPCSQGTSETRDTLSDLTFTTRDAKLLTNNTVSKFFSVHQVNTIREGLDFITHQINLMLQASQGIIFDRYRLHGVNEIRYGGQGLVHFASSRFTPKQYAIKFFVVRAAFQAEVDMYHTPGLRSVLPPLDDMSDNNDCKWTDPLGRPLPPFLIMEKGEALDEFVQRAAPDSLSTLALIGHLMDAVAKVHNTGLAHRDLKPANCIFLSSTNSWTLIDFGSAAAIGRDAPMSISAHYAAPEVATAYQAGEETIPVTAAVDVWSLGLMAFELFCKTKVFPDGSTREQVFDALTGRAKLPWEKEDDPMFPTYMKQLGRMRAGVLSMIHRDPAQRAQLNQVRTHWHSIFDYTTQLKPEPPASEDS